MKLTKGGIHKISFQLCQNRDEKVWISKEQVVQFFGWGGWGGVKGEIMK